MKEHRPLFVLLLIGFVIYGAAFTTFGATVPLIIQEFQWNYATTGVVLAALSVGFFVATYLSGLFLEGAGAKKIYIGAAVLCAVVLALFGRSPSPAVNVILCFLAGCAQGTIDLATNYETVRLEKEGHSKLMNILHAAFSAGGIVGPLAVGALITAGVPWRAAFLAYTVLFLVLAGAAAFARFPVPQARVPRAAKGGVAFLKHPVMLLLCASIILYVGIEVGASNWVAEYFVKIISTTPMVGAFAVSALWMGMLLGRSLLSLASGRARHEIVLLCLSVISVAALLAFLLSHTVAPAIASVALLGIGFSGVFPLIMTITGQTFKSPTAVGMVATSAGLGSFSLSFLLAAIAQAAGLRWGFALLLVLLVGIIGCTIALARMIPRHAPEEADRAGAGGAGA
jgi:fucose permease